MERIAMIRRLRTVVLVAAVPLFAACTSLLDNETMGTASGTTSASNGNVNFIHYAAIGTSLGAGIQSAGINDSTQKQAYPYLLATAMGLTPGVDWFYPALAMPGCPAPYTNIGAGTRVGPPAASCYLRVPGSVEANVNNTSIPGIRAVHVLDISNTTYPTDATPNAASQFYTGNVNPISMVTRLGATMVTLEVGANDALQAALGGNAGLLTPAATFQAQMTEIADSLDDIGMPVAVANVPDVTRVPHMTYGYWFYCLKNGCGAPLNIPATPPFTAGGFIVNTSCSHPASGLGGKGDSTMVAFPTTAGIAKSLQLGAAIVLDCAGDSVRINTGAGFVAPNPATQFPAYTLSPAEYGAIRTRIGEFNSAIATLANRPNWTLVDINAALGLPAVAAQIPPFPNLAVLSTPGANPNLLFGTPFGAPTAAIFSQDGFHPNGAGMRIMAQTFAAAINAEWGTAITIP